MCQLPARRRMSRVAWSWRWVFVGGLDYGCLRCCCGTVLPCRLQKLVFLCLELNWGDRSELECDLDKDHGAAVAAAFDAGGQQVGADIQRRYVLVRRVVRLRRVPRMDPSLLDDLVPLCSNIRSVDICRTTVYGETTALRAAAAAGCLERHAGYLQHGWRCQDHSWAGAYFEMARFRRVCMQVTLSLFLHSYCNQITKK